MNKIWIDSTLKIRLPLLLLAVLVAYVVTFYVSAPERTNVGHQPEQPIAFSHKAHVQKLKMDCIYCHTGVEKGRHALIPSTAICMNCHTQVRIKKPEIQKLAKYWKEKKSPQWNRVYRVPEYVYFDHSVHVKKGLDCTACHGDVSLLDTLKQVKRTTMGMCIQCHKGMHQGKGKNASLLKASLDCSSCHR